METYDRFVSQSALLGCGYRVVMFDLRGHWAFGQVIPTEAKAYRTFARLDDNADFLALGAAARHIP